MNTTERICLWNAERYDPENPDLNVSLIPSEIEEYYAAASEADQLDALIDIVYYSIGAMWKMGLTPYEIDQAIDVVCDANATKDIDKVPPYIKANIDKGDGFIAPEPRLQEILDGRS